MQSRNLAGMVDFVCPRTGRRMTTVPLYEGEKLEGFEILLRAQRHLKLESMPVGRLGSNPFQEHHANLALRKVISQHR